MRKLPTCRSKLTDGTLAPDKDSNLIYVVDKGQKRRIADNETFKALGL